MHYLGIFDGYENMARLGEFLRYNEYWFKWILEQREALEVEFTLQELVHQVRQKAEPKEGVVEF